MLYVANIDEAQIAAPGADGARVFEHAARRTAARSRSRGKIESELAGLSATRKRRSSGATSGSSAGGLDRLIVEAYDLLGLMTFLTAGEKEARAWTIENGTKAPQAAGKIHSDIERGFIRAEIIVYADYVALPHAGSAAAAGQVRSEGKEYVMREGDVVEFRFNV